MWLMDGHDVDVRLAQRLQDALELALQHRESRRRRGRCRRSPQKAAQVLTPISLAIAQPQAAALAVTADDDLEHPVLGLALDADGTSSTALGVIVLVVPAAVRPANPEAGSRGLRPDLLDLVERAAHAGGERLRSRRLTADVHEVDLRVVEERVVVERGDLQPGVEQLAEHRVHLVLEEHEVAHDHGLAAARRRGTTAHGDEAHEGRHGPAVDGDLGVGPRRGDLEDAFRLRRGSP